MPASLLNVQVIRFLLVGLMNSAVGFCTFSVAFWLFHDSVIALLAGNIAGLAFNFFSTGGLVFRTTALKRLPKFAAAYLLVMLINYGGLEILMHYLESKIVAQAFLTLPIAALSYVILTFWVYKQDIDRGTS
jgi:putative flippase GtrA